MFRLYDSLVNFCVYDVLAEIAKSVRLIFFGHKF